MGSGVLGTAEEEVVAPGGELSCPGELEQDAAAGEFIARRVGGHTQYGAGVPGGGLVGGSLDP